MTDNSNHNKNIIWGFVFIFAFLMGMVFSYTPYGTGDKTDYIMTTESIIYDHDLVYDKDVDLKRHLARKPETIDYTPWIIYLIKQTRDGQVRFGAHSFYYPLFSAPFYMAFSRFGPHFSHYGFYFFNALLFFGCVLMGFLYLRKKSGDTGALIFSTLFFFLSASVVYILWIHGEILSLFLGTGFLFFWKTKRYALAAVFIGLAAGVRPPMLAFYMPFMYELYLEKNYRTAGISLAITIALIMPQMFYNLYYLGTFNPLVREGLASVRYISLSTVIGSFIDPFYGLVWFYPLVLLGLINMRLTVKNLLTILAGIIIIIGMNSNVKLYSHQVGQRYLVLIYPLFLFITEEIRLNFVNKALIALSLLIIAGVVINPINNSQALPPTKMERFTYLPYKAAKYIFHVKDDPEVSSLYNPKLSSRISVLEGNERFTADHMIKAGETVKLIMYSISEGEIGLTVTGRVKPQPQKFTVLLNDDKRFNFTLEPGKTTSLSIPISKADIYHYSNRWIKDLVYLDLLAGPQGNAGAAPDAGEITLVAVSNNDKMLFGKRPTIELKDAVKILEGSVTGDRWTAGGQWAWMEISAASEGEILLKLNPWALKKPQKVRLTVNDGPETSRTIVPGKPLSVRLHVSKDDITVEEGRALGYVRVGIFAEPWTPAVAIPGNKDKRVLGVRVREIRANNRIVFRGKNKTAETATITPAHNNNDGRKEEEK